LLPVTPACVYVLSPVSRCPVTAADPLLGLALDVGRTSVAGLDLTALLARISTALPATMGIASAVVLVAERSEEDATVVASDARSHRIGEAQRRSRSGPLLQVLRTGRPMVTPDLTRQGPPELAAAAAAGGLTTSLVVPIAAADERFGALQLLGDAHRPVDAAAADPVQPLVQALAARLVDMKALRALSASRVPTQVRVDPGDVATVPVPAVPAPRRPEGGARHRMPEDGARHRRAEDASAGQSDGGRIRRLPRP
jgi:transcriptional regulator with GAF, ATPase, and Fis domain